MTRAKTSSPAELTWRPADRHGRTCLYTFRSKTCRRRGAHYCEPRADRVVQFFATLLVHTKGPFARQPFILRPWQEAKIIRPLFGEVIWSPDWGRYVRRYRVAFVVMGRKNGKSEIVAGIVLYLLVGDDEESAEIYGAAKDTKQAGKVFEPALRMMQLSPVLAKRLTHNKNARRIIDEKTASYYEIITADAEGELGHNPHGFVLDEVLSQPDDSLWNAMRTAAGTRVQSLMLAITTETNRAPSFGADLIDEAERIQEDPARAPHIFSYVRKTPIDADPWDEANWPAANPALGDFLSVEALREEALEANNDPSKENSFRQFRLNQRQSQSSRWMPMHRYDECAGDLWLRPDWGRKQLAGRTAWFGFDLAAKFDLTSWALLIPDGELVHALWRFWLPEDALPHLNKHGDGKWTKWVKDGWITVTEGNVVDYDRIYADVEADAKTFTLAAGDCDQWSMAPVIQEIEKRTGIREIVAYNNTYQRMTPGMNDLMALVKTGTLQHHGNPVARSCFDTVEVRRAPYDPQLIRPEKPVRERSGHRIDAVPAVAMACSARTRGAAKTTRRAGGF